MSLNTHPDARFPVALPWYNFAQTRPLLDGVWERVVVELRRVGVNSPPSALDHSTPHQQLLHIPELSLSQCCGPDLFQGPGLKVQPIAAPVISAYEVAPGDYYSYIAARDGADIQRVCLPCSRAGQTLRLSTP